MKVDFTVARLHAWVWLEDNRGGRVERRRALGGTQAMWVPLFLCWCCCWYWCWCCCFKADWSSSAPPRHTILSFISVTPLFHLALCTHSALPQFSYNFSSWVLSNNGSLWGCMLLHFLSCFEIENVNELMLLSVLCFVCLRQWLSFVF